MANQINPDLPKNKELAKQVLDNTKELEHLKAEMGFLGQFWGSSKSIPNNIAGLIIVLLTFTGICYTFFTMNTPSDKLSISIKDYWALISPIITLALGYLFGMHNKGGDTSSE